MLESSENNMMSKVWINLANTYEFNAIATYHLQYKTEVLDY
jgi:hypothetical protein